MYLEKKKIGPYEENMTRYKSTIQHAQGLFIVTLGSFYLTPIIMKDIKNPLQISVCCMVLALHW